MEIEHDFPENGPTVPNLITLLGLHRAFDVVFHLGGVRNFIPKDAKCAAKQRSYVSRLLTESEVEKIASVWGGCYVAIGLDRAFCAHYLFRVRGYSKIKVARKLRMTEKGATEALRRPLPPEVEEALARELAA